MKTGLIQLFSRILFENPDKIHNPEEVIRREYLSVVSPSLREIKTSWRPFAQKHVTLWAKYIDQWIRHAKGDLVFQVLLIYRLKISLLIVFRALFARTGQSFRRVFYDGQFERVS